MKGQKCIKLVLQYSGCQSQGTACNDEPPQSYNVAANNHGNGNVMNVYLRSCPLRRFSVVAEQPPESHRDFRRRSR